MKILSISDVITNSSSEVFCYITGEKGELEQVYKSLDSVFGYNQELEITPVVDLEDDKIIVDLPYHTLAKRGVEAYFRKGIEGLLEYFEGCKVDFNE